MLKRSELLQSISQNLSIYQYFIGMNTAANKTDTNKECEPFFGGLFNLIFGYKLIYLESESTNHPGIDLGDLVNKIGIQVTASTTRNKVVETIKTFENPNNNLLKPYKKLIVFMIGKKDKFSVPKTNGKYQLKIMDMYDLFKEISIIDSITKLEEINNFILSEVKPVVQQLSTDIIKIKKKLKNFTNANSFLVSFFGEEDLEQLTEVSTTQNELRILENYLGELSDKTRAVIILITEEKLEGFNDSIYFNPNSISEISPFDAETLNKHWSILQSKGFIRNAEDDDLSIPDIWELRFKGISSEIFPFLIDHYCKKDNSYLIKLLLDLDFRILD